MSNAIIVKDGITPALRQLAEQHPKEFQRALVNMGQRWRRILGTEMRKGAPNGQAFTPLSAMTLALRQGKIVTIRRANRRKGIAALQTATGPGAQIRLSRRQMKAEGVGKDSKRWQKTVRTKKALVGFGGKLPDIAEYSMPQETGGVEAGWIGKIFAGSNRSSARWQRSEARLFTRAERRKFHVIFGERLPMESYNRPSRPPIAPQAERFSQDAQTTIPKTIQALLANAARYAARFK